jgi:hypothetical protein
MLCTITCQKSCCMLNVDGAVAGIVPCRSTCIQQQPGMGTAGFDGIQHGCCVTRTGNAWSAMHNAHCMQPLPGVGTAGSNGIRHGCCVPRTGSAWSAMHNAHCMQPLLTQLLIGHVAHLRMCSESCSLEPASDLDRRVELEDLLKRTHPSSSMKAVLQTVWHMHSISGIYLQNRALNGLHPGCIVFASTFEA